MNPKNSDSRSAGTTVRLTPILFCIFLALNSGFAYGQKAIRATTEDGKQVFLDADGTWRYIETPKSDYEKSPSATQRVKTPKGDFAIWIDPAKWRQTKTDEPGRLVFETVSGDAYAVVISEGLPMPTEALRGAALLNARNGDPNAEVVFEEKRVVNGREILCLKLRGSPMKIPMMIYGYYYGGTSGSIQVVTLTGRSLFEESESELTQFLNGLEVYDTEYRPSPTTSKEGQPPGKVNELSLLSGNIVVAYDSHKWREEASKEPGIVRLQHTSGDGYAVAITERIEIPLDSLKEIALSNARDAAPDARITFEEERLVNGVEVLCLKIEGTMNGIPFIYYGYYHGGKAGTVQLLTYTGAALFGEYENDFTEFLNGLHIIE